MTTNKTVAFFGMIFVLFFLVPYGISEINGSPVTPTETIPATITVDQFTRIDYANANGMVTVANLPVLPNMGFMVHEACANKLSEIDWNTTTHEISQSLRGGYLMSLLGTECFQLQATWDVANGVCRDYGFKSTCR